MISCMYICWKLDMPFICRTPTEVQLHSAVWTPDTNLPFFHALSYFNQKQVQLMQILYSGAGARTYPFSHYYIHEDGRTFSSSKHTRAIQPMIKRKSANCRCISRRWSFFSSLQRPKKDLLCTYPIASITLTWQFDQRDNFLRRKELLFVTHQWPAECSSPEAESNLVFPQDLVRVVKLLELGQEVDLRR